MRSASLIKEEEIKKIVLLKNLYFLEIEIKEILYDELSKLQIENDSLENCILFGIILMQKEQLIIFKKFS